MTTHSTDSRGRVGDIDLWIPGSFSREELREALLGDGPAGLNAHDRPNIQWKIRRLCEADPDSQFGLTGVDCLTQEEVLALMAETGGFPVEAGRDDELAVWVDPDKVIAAFEAVGDRLALAAERGERVILATGHPVGLPLLYQATARLLAMGGAKIIRPLEGFTWKHEARKRQVRYLGGVGVLTDRASSVHTHSPEAMELMLEEALPDLVFADHGFAGAAMEAGVDTVAIADVNDPALVVAWRQGRGGPVVVMDDNVQPEAYWPCFQVIAARFARAGLL
jgi:histidinol phosphate phosphatase hisN-like protein